MLGAHELGQRHLQPEDDLQQSMRTVVQPCVERHDVERHDVGEERQNRARRRSSLQLRR